MIGFHIQNSPEGWTQADGKLPDNAVIKFLFGIERASEAKTKSWYRWVGDQPLVTGPGLEQHCRNWLNQFVDGTFIREAQHISYTQEYNETFANSQSESEREAWKELHKTMARLWATEYRTRPELAHVRLILAETAIGNDIPLGVARAAQEYDAIVGYHPYIVCRHKQVSPADWRWYSGRWETMDEFYLANGVSVDWAFGEMGPVLDASANWSGWLDPYGGWKHPDCLAGDINAYLNVLKYWLDNATKTKAYRQGRIIGGVLFTSGAPGSGPDWKHFDIQQPHMNTIADFVASYPYPDTGNPPPPPPPPPDNNGEPRIQYKRKYAVIPVNATEEQAIAIFTQAWQEGRITTGGSYDDAGVGALDDKTAILYGIAEARKNDFREWFAEHYPGTKIEFRAMPDNVVGDHEIIDIVDELPKHPDKEYKTRNLAQIRELVIHHTVSPPERPPSSLALYHINHHDWPGIGYHFVIDGNGSIFQTNKLATISYHVGIDNSINPDDENLTAVGIALQGDFTNEPPNAEQLQSAQWLVDYIRSILGDGLEVLGHKDIRLASTQCPGNTWGHDWIIS